MVFLLTEIFKIKLDYKFNTPEKIKNLISKTAYTTKLYQANEILGVLETVADVVNQAIL